MGKARWWSGGGRDAKANPFGFLPTATVHCDRFVARALKADFRVHGKNSDGGLIPPGELDERPGCAEVV